MIYPEPLFRIMGDKALIVELGEGIDQEVNEWVRRVALAAEEAPLEGVQEIVPTYRSLLLLYDPLKVGTEVLKGWILQISQRAREVAIPEAKTVTIPVLYGGEYGPDLEWVARYHGIPPEEVVRLHTGRVYRVYMIGFVPGFPYMGEVAEEIATPRRETPRTSIPAGSVGIAQRQTGIYPVESPGGWQIIGRTPLKLFDPEREPPSLLRMGDRVRFVSIGEEEYKRWPPLQP